MRTFVKADIVLYIFLMLLGVGGFFVALIWPQTEGFYSFMVLAALGGFGVAAYIYYGKHFKEQLACPMGSDCNVVVNSKYAKFLGISLEYYGMIYYLIIVISYAALIFYPVFRESELLPIVLILTAGAFIFSLYLLTIQGFVLRQWCIWCLLSATLSIAIFIVSLTSVEFVRGILLQATEILFFIRSLGFVIGMGTATALLFLFFKFLKNDLDIDDNETNTLLHLSELIWLGIGLIFISMYALFVSNPGGLSSSATFVVQVAALSVTFVSGAILNIVFAPVISVVPFYENKMSEENKPSLLSSLRRSGFIIGGISLASWYFAFALAYISEPAIIPLVIAYVVVLVLTVSCGCVLNWKMR